MLQLERMMDALPEQDVNAAISRITRDWEYPLGKPKETAIARAIRIYLATVQICKEKDFSGMSYKCVEGIPAFLQAVHSVPAALVATDGYPYVDEDDVCNVVAELMLKWLSGQTTTFLEHYEHAPEWILLGMDGMVPVQLMAGKPQIKPISTVLLDGLVFCGPMKTGRMTLACLSEDDHGYRMHIVTGEGRTPPQWVVARAACSRSSA